MIDRHHTLLQLAYKIMMNTGTVGLLNLALTADAIR